jgi:hypothetical protein
MKTLLVVLAVFALHIHAAENSSEPARSYETSNCRIQSRANPGSRSWTSILKMGDRVAANEERDLMIDDCMKRLRSLALSASLFGGSVTELEFGDGEIRAPNTAQEFIRCTYRVEAGHKIPNEILNFLERGLEQNQGESFESYLKRIDALEEKVGTLVVLDCPIS